ncbi:MAG: hypothetical protein J6Q30_05200 [Oscillospiraceae bacterium]|nr:hypothetical protein [Oscillospiraceae bacterium]
MKILWNKICIKWIAISEFTGVISGILSINGIPIFNVTQLNAPLTPLGWVFLGAAVWILNF